MRVFVISRKMLKIYALAIVAILGIYIGGTNIGEAVFTGDTAGEIPIYCVDTDEKKIALTFDAAWGNSDTDELIKVLGDNSAKASIFTVGGWIDRFPEDVKKFHEAGHEILNHSDTHAHMANLSEEQIKKELTDCENKIKNITGKEQKLFRAPYGEYTDTVVKTATDAGFFTIQWDVDSLDWKDLTAEEINKRVLSKVKNGSIILMHNGAKNTPEALKTLLPALKEKGFEIVPVSELIYRENYRIDNSGKQIKN